MGGSFLHVGGLYELSPHTTKILLGPMLINITQLHYCSCCFVYGWRCPGVCPRCMSPVYVSGVCPRCMSPVYVPGVCPRCMSPVYVPVYVPGVCPRCMSPVYVPGVCPRCMSPVYVPGVCPGVCPRCMSPVYVTAASPVYVICVVFLHPSCSAHYPGSVRRQVFLASISQRHVLFTLYEMR